MTGIPIVQNIPYLREYLDYLRWLADTPYVLIALGATVFLMFRYLQPRFSIGGHDRGPYLTVWALRIMLVVAAWLAFAFPKIPFIGLPVKLSTLADLRYLFLAQLILDAAAVIILHIKSRHWLEYLFTFNFTILAPYPALALFSLLWERRKDSNLTVTETKEGLLLGEAEEAISKVPVISRDETGGSIRGETWRIHRVKGKLFYTPEQELNPHVALVGKSGVGKTSVTVRLITELTKLGHQIIVLDFAKSEKDPNQAEYAARAGLFGGKIINVGKTGFNPFTPAAGESVKARVSDFMAAMNIIDKYNPGVGHQAAVGRIAEAVGNDVTIEHVAEAVDKRKEEEKHGHVYDALSTLSDRLYLWGSDFGQQTGFTFKQLVEGNMVVDLSDIDNDEVKTIAAELLLRKLLRYITYSRDEVKKISDALGPLLIQQVEVEAQERATRVKPRQLLAAEKVSEITKILAQFGATYVSNGEDQHWVIESKGKIRFLVVDEAHRLGKEHGIIERVMRETRKYNFGCILVSQRAADFDDAVISIPSLKLVFATDSEKDEDSLVNITGCDLLRQVLPAQQQFRALVMRRSRETVKELAKTGAMKGATTTLYIVKLKPFFDGEGKEQAQEKEQTEAEKTTEEKHADEKQPAAIQENREPSPATQEAKMGTAAVPLAVEEDSKVLYIREMMEDKIAGPILEALKSTDLDILKRINYATESELERMAYMGFYSKWKKEISINGERVLKALEEFQEGKAKEAQATAEVKT